MAEESVYGNASEPKFPFDRVIGDLAWLPSYLSAFEPKDGDDHLGSRTFIALLDTVLVFGRARTAGLHNTKDLQQCRRLASRLNTVIEGVGEDALHHRVSIVRRGPSGFFITCCNSPRFDWRLRLTNFQIGKNLDMFAAGHMFPPPRPPRGVVRFLERETSETIFVECILLDCLEDEKFEGALVTFNNAKQVLINKTMEGLGLRYRVQWFLECPKEKERVTEVMRNSQPPSLEWWRDNWELVNQPLPLSPYYVPFCTYYTKHHTSWPLLQYLYFFSLESSQNKHRHGDLKYGLHCWEIMSDIYEEVRTSLPNEMSSVEIETLSASVKERLEKLAETSDKMGEDRTLLSKNSASARYRLNRYFTYHVCYQILLLVEWTKLNLLHRQRLRKPLLYETPPLPAGVEEKSGM